MEITVQYLRQKAAAYRAMAEALKNNANATGGAAQALEELANEMEAANKTAPPAPSAP